MHWWGIMEKLSNILCLATMKDLAFYLAITISWETFKRQITPFLDLLLHLYWYNLFRRKMSNASFLVVNESYWNAFKEFAIGSLTVKRVCPVYDYLYVSRGCSNYPGARGINHPSPLYSFHFQTDPSEFWSALWWNRFSF